MATDSIPRSILVITFVLFSAFFSMAETAFSHCNRIRMKVLSDDGDKRGKRVVWILGQFDRTLVTILIGNNIVNVAGSAIATVLFVGWFGDSGPLLSTIVMTLLIFLFSETIPKNIARVNSDAVSLAFSMPITFLIYLFTPLEYIFIGIATGVKKMIGAKQTPTMTEDEFSTFIESVEEEGILEPDESKIIRSAIEFGDKTVSEIMRPNSEIVAIEKNAKKDEIKEALLNGRFSRVPVYDKDIDHIIGILQTRAFLQSLIRNKPFPIVKNLLPASYVNPDMRINDVFEMMSRQRSHLAVVRKTGKTLGIITMEDILEEIVGDIYDEFDDVTLEPAFLEGGAPNE